jgi:hypothetical protein
MQCTSEKKNRQAVLETLRRKHDKRQKEEKDGFEDLMENTFDAASF